MLINRRLVSYSEAHWKYYVMIKFVLVRSDVFPDTLVTSTNKFVRHDIADNVVEGGIHQNMFQDTNG